MTVTQYPGGRPYPENRRVPRRSIAIADELWEAVKERAATDGMSATDVVNHALRTYLDDNTARSPRSQL